MNELAWQSDARCHDVGIGPFFDEDSFEQARQSFCRACPVRNACLTYALAHREYGLWGGTSWTVRAAILRGVARKRCPGCRFEEIQTRAAVDELGDTLQLCPACGLSWAVPPRPQRRENGLVEPARSVRNASRQASSMRHALPSTV